MFYLSNFLSEFPDIKLKPQSTFAADGLLKGFVFDKVEAIFPLLANVGTATGVGEVGVIEGVLGMAGALLVLDGTFPPPHAHQCSVADPISPL